MDMEQNTEPMDLTFSQKKTGDQEQLLNLHSSMPNPDSTVNDDSSHLEMVCEPPKNDGVGEPAEGNELPENVKIDSPKEEDVSAGNIGVDPTVDFDICTCSDIDFNFSIAINYITTEMETSVPVSNVSLEDDENSTIRKVLISTLISPDYLPVYTHFYGKNMFFILEFGYRVSETVMQLPVLNLADLVRAEFGPASIIDEAKKSFLAFAEAEDAFLSGLKTATTPTETRLLLLRFLIDADASCVEAKCRTIQDLPQLVDFIVMINCLMHKTMVCTTQIKNCQLQNLLTAARIVCANLRMFVEFLGSCCSVVRYNMTKLHCI